jgi:hypothetical protein
MSSARTLNPLRRLASIGLSFAVAATTIVATSALSVGTAQAADTYYPWAKVASTGDYLADAYTGLASGHVFENVTTDRLLDILSSNGNYYIAFAGPEHPASQALLPVIDAAARAKGITKIYHFDPYVDGYQLDSTLANGVADVTGGTSVNFGGTAKISDVWKLITQLLPASTIASGGALENYAGNTAVLLNVNISDRKNVETGKTVTKLAELKDADVAAFTADTGSVKTDAAAALNTAFAGKTSSVRTQFEFFSRLYNASATKTEGSTASADRYGSAVSIFDPADYPNAGDFVLKAIDVKELYNLLNSAGEFPILFAGQGCHNTQAIIGSVAKRAKELHLPVVYVVDFALDSNVKFGTGDAIDTASANSATGGLWIRSGSATLATSAPYRYGYSYLYGKLAEYFGPSWITENSSKKSNSVAYYPNAVLGETSTVNPFATGFDPTTQLANATRLQVPTIVRYNKDAANPIVGEWLHKDKVADGADQTYTEYMLELSWVRGTDLAKADASRSVGRDGLTKTEFGAEAVASLDRVLTHNGSVIHEFANAPAPWIEGTAAVGQQLTANLETLWTQSPNLVYQWHANGVAISGANDTTYTITPSDAGKKITVSLTASRPDYRTTTTVSDPTDAVASIPFTAAATPTISGTVRVGATLTANPGTWDPTATFSYSWKADGVVIKGATKASYTLTAAEAGKKITVTVTGSATGYVAQSKTSAATAAVAKVFAKTPAPKVTGTAKVGSTLKAKLSAWSPSAKISYQWLANGAVIKGATKSSLKLGAAQVGAKITLAVTGSKAGYASVTKTSTATKSVAAAKFAKAPAPKITGTAKVGSVLKLKLGTWSPKAGVTFSYQWFAGGAAVLGATKSSYTLTAAERGKKITVKVTAVKAGYATTIKAAKATAAVK